MMLAVYSFGAIFILATLAALFTRRGPSKINTIDECKTNPLIDAFYKRD